MRAGLAAFALALSFAGAAAAPRDPFLPPSATPAQRVEVLTPPYFLDRASIEAFEASSGLTVALDTYANAAELAERNAQRRYDLVVLSGPALARRVASLTRLDRTRLPNAARLQPGLAAKWVVYDRLGAYGAPLGWSAFGILYDSDKLREAPLSWAQVFGLAKGTLRVADCGTVWPDAPEDSFLAAWRLLGVDPERARAAEVKTAGALLERARGTFVAFAAPDEVGALAKGAACIGAGTDGEAAAVAARGGDNAPPVRFAYPRDGAAMKIYAYAIPLHAPAPDAAYALLDKLLEPETARREAASAGLIGAEEATDLDDLKRLTPEPVFLPAVAEAMAAEWKRLTAAK